MSLISVASLLVLIAMATAEDTSPRHFDLNEAQSLFEKFVKDYSRKYKDDADREEHFLAFKASLASINEMNEKSPHATYGINKYADYTAEERKNMFGFKNN